MDLKTLLLLVLIGVIVVKVTASSNSPTPSSQEGFASQGHSQPSKPATSCAATRSMEELADSIAMWERERTEVAAKVNPNFINTQFHKDFQDILNAKKLIVPATRQLFNIPNIPVEYSEPAIGEVLPIVDQFVELLNRTINESVVLDAHRFDGWAKQKRDLGLPPLYHEVAGKTEVFLVEARKPQKYTVQYETKYNVELILGKKGVADQIALKISFVQDQRAERNDEDIFFNPTSEAPPVHVEKIFVIGYLGAPDAGSYPEANSFHPLDSNEFADFDQMEKNEGVSLDEIRNVLWKKYLTRVGEMEQRTADIDEEGRVFDPALTATISKYPSYAVTQTIDRDFEGGMSRQFA